VRLADFLRTWEGHVAENRFSRIIILGLLVVCVITSLAAWRTERSIILVPPTLTKEVEVTRPLPPVSSKSPGVCLSRTCGFILCGKVSSADW